MNQILRLTSLKKNVCILKNKDICIDMTHNSIGSILSSINYSKDLEVKTIES